MTGTTVCQLSAGELAGAETETGELSEACKTTRLEETERGQHGGRGLDALHTVVTVRTAPSSVYLAKTRTGISADGMRLLLWLPERHLLSLSASHDPPCVGHALSPVTR